MGFGPLALLLPETAQAHGGAQLQRFRLLAAGDVQGPLQPGFRLRRRCPRLPQEQDAPQATDFCFPVAFLMLLHQGVRLGQRLEAVCRVAQGTSFREWALAMQGQGEEGLVQERQGLAAWRATGAAMRVPYFCTLLADVSAHLGHTEDGLQALAEAHTLMEQHEDRWWEAEVSRLRGVLLLRQTMPQQAEAETWLQRALDVARRQEAKALELRAAMSLGRLWQQQGKQAEARELLAPIYGWFTEGFDTADLQEAKVLLEALIS